MKRDASAWVSSGVSSGCRWISRRYAAIGSSRSIEPVVARARSRESGTECGSSWSASTTSTSLSRGSANASSSGAATGSESRAPVTLAGASSSASSSGLAAAASSSSSTSSPSCGGRGSVPVGTSPLAPLRAFVPRARVAAVLGGLAGLPGALSGREILGDRGTMADLPRLFVRVSGPSGVDLRRVTHTTRAPEGRSAVEEDRRAHRDGHDQREQQLVTERHSGEARGQRHGRAWKLGRRRLVRGLRHGGQRGDTNALRQAPSSSRANAEILATCDVATLTLAPRGRIFEPP